MIQVILGFGFNLGLLDWLFDCKLHNFFHIEPIVAIREYFNCERVIARLSIGSPVELYFVLLRIAEAEMLKIGYVVAISDQDPPAFHFQEWIPDGITEITFPVRFYVQDDLDVVHCGQLLVARRVDDDLQLLDPWNVADCVLDVLGPLGGQHGEQELFLFGIPMELGKVEGPFLSLLVQLVKLLLSEV